MIEWLEIKADGLYSLSKNKLRRKESTIYICGDSPKGSFTIGIYDKEKNFVECPFGNSDVSFVVRHGAGVKLMLRVNGYMGMQTSVGYLASNRKKIIVVIAGIVGPAIGLLFDALIDKITKKF